MEDKIKTEKKEDKKIISKEVLEKPNPQPEPGANHSLVVGKIMKDAENFIKNLNLDIDLKDNKNDERCQVHIKGSPEFILKLLGKD